MRLTLRTFGGPALLGAAGESSFADQRRKPLALLVLLGVAGERGMTRDKVAGFLWRDGDQERVRGALKQTLYLIRQALGSQDVILGSNDLRLNLEMVEPDVTIFEQATARQDALSAVALYHAPFLDGFHLDDAPDFERWVDVQRDRLARAFAAHIERLALAAMAQLKPREAADWWLRLTAHDPLDVRAVSGLLHACLQDGDRPRAIKYAERHMNLLRKELEITPDPEIRRLVEQARARPGQP